MGRSYAPYGRPLTFGLGGAPDVDSLEITWPDGKRQEVMDIPEVATVLVWQEG